jgi:hypothetical protein
MTDNKRDLEAAIINITAVLARALPKGSEAVRLAQIEGQRLVNDLNGSCRAWAQAVEYAIRRLPAADPRLEALMRDLPQGEVVGYVIRVPDALVPLSYVVGAMAEGAGRAGHAGSFSSRKDENGSTVVIEFKSPSAAEG